MPYAKIELVKFDGLSIAPGNQVRAVVVVKNVLSNGYVAITAPWNGQRAIISPVYTWLETGVSTSFILTFTMPSNNVEVMVSGWDWLQVEDFEGNPTGEWQWFVSETVGPYAIAAQVEVPTGTVKDFEVAYRKA